MEVPEQTWPEPSHRRLDVDRSNADLGSASAQSPSPNVYFTDWRPGNVHYTTNGLIVEGLGMMVCAYSLSGVEADTVSDIRSGHATITEISPQNGCIPNMGQHIGAYESTIQSLVAYVEANAPTAGSLWAGIVLDEEPDFGLDPLHISALNNWVQNEMLTTPGISYWHTNLGVYSGTWSQAQYTAFTNGCYNGQHCTAGLAAPQVYTGFEAAYANGTGFDGQLVTTWTGAPYPYNSASYASSVINGTPYDEKFGTTHTFYWEWTWQPQ